LTFHFNFISFSGENIQLMEVSYDEHPEGDQEKENALFGVEDAFDLQALQERLRKIQLKGI